MHIRCPTAQYLGVARLDGYKWLINDRGYANVVEIPSNETQVAQLGHILDEATASESTKEDYSEVVYGLVYTLLPEDERRLDINEGVPTAYTKIQLQCTFWSAGAPSAPDESHRTIDTSHPPTYTRDMLVYIDKKRITPDEPRKEYIYRMNKGIADAVKMGVPEGYVEDVMRKFIPMEKGEGDGKGVREFAEGQAKEFRDESGVMQ